MQQLKRMGVGSGSEEDPTHSGEFHNVTNKKFNFY